MSTTPEEIAWVAKTTILQMRDDGALLDVNEIIDGVARAYQRQLAPEVLARLRAFVTRWVQRCELQRRTGTVPPRPASDPPRR